jgi:hypothetical protein
MILARAHRGSAAGEKLYMVRQQRSVGAEPYLQKGPG